MLILMNSEYFDLITAGLCLGHVLSSFLVVHPLSVRTA